ncbi:hypothetical protein GCM10023346_36900 [Arthrobacter gyeryongensis]|uniref:DUF3800 domain-containing protein n=1 Tax=Arthrobacter gyeryongensis TaxID=1650592 RepID=A0ABP9SQF4_9MICC
MADVFMYVDETGNLDFNGASKGSAASIYFTTFLCKANAYDAVRTRGQMELYKLAWRLHFSEIAKQVSTREDTLYVIAGTFGTNKRSELARESLREVCNAQDRNIILCVWESSSSWGLQVADYALGLSSDVWKSVNARGSSP